jgi:excisionase family DNA binding protein
LTRARPFMDDIWMRTPVVRPLTRTDVLSTTEVAELLGIPRSTVYDLARRGDLPARRVGRPRCSSASASRPPSHRSTIRLRGGLNATSDGSSATPKRYSAKSLARADTAPSSKKPRRSGAFDPRESSSRGAGRLLRPSSAAAMRSANRQRPSRARQPPYIAVPSRQRSSSPRQRHGKA